MIGGLLMLVLIAGGIWAFSQYESHRHEAADRGSEAKAANPALERWVAAELISAEQASAIAAFEAQRRASRPARKLAVARSSRVPAVAEGLGYLGAVLALTSLVVVLSRSWSDLAVGAQLGIAALAALLGIGGGWVVDEASDPALARLRWSLWALGSAAVGVAAWVVADPWAGLRSDQQVDLIVSAAVALSSGLLWMGRVRPVQQLAASGCTLAALAFATTSIFNPGVAGALLWLAALALLASAWLLPIGTPAVGSLVGAAGVMAGGFTMAASWQAWGLTLASASALALLLAAGWRGVAGARAAHLAAGAVGVVGLFAALPQTIGYLAGEGGLATGLVVFAAGLLVLVLAGRGLVALVPAYAFLGAGLALGAPGIVAAQFKAVGLIAGLAVAVAFLAIGAMPGRAPMSAIGLLGLLAYVPTTLLHFFPGRSKGPLAILVTGLLLLVGAVLLARRRGELRRDVTGMGQHRGHGLPGQPA